MQIRSQSHLSKDTCTKTHTLTDTAHTPTCINSNLYLCIQISGVRPCVCASTCVCVCVCVYLRGQYISGVSDRQIHTDTHTNIQSQFVHIFCCYLYHIAKQACLVTVTSQISKPRYLHTAQVQNASIKPFIIKSIAAEYNSRVCFLRRGKILYEIYLSSASRNAYQNECTWIHWACQRWFWTISIFQKVFSCATYLPLQTDVFSRLLSSHTHKQTDTLTRIIETQTLKTHRR